MLATSTTDSSTEQNVNLSAKTSFGRHETFRIRDGWLVKVYVVRIIRTEEAIC